MAQLETWIRQDLKKPLQVQYLSGTMFSQDNAANLVGVEVFDDGEPATLGGSVSANVVRSDGGTVAVSTGTVSGNKVSVVLPQAAYAIPGQISIIIKLTAGGTVTTLGAIVVTVYRSSTDAVVDPGTIIPSVQNLISQIETAVASIPADYSNLWTSLAPAFSSSTAYTAGQYVTYNGHLYRFTANHAAGSFVNTDCTQVDVCSELSLLKSAIDVYERNTIGIIDNAVNATWTEGYTINASGELTSMNGMHYSSLLPVYGNTTRLIINARATSAKSRFHGYDENGTWIRELYNIVLSSGLNNLTFDSTGVVYIRLATQSVNEVIYCGNSHSLVDIMDGMVQGSNLNITPENRETICGSDLNNIPLNKIYVVSPDSGLQNCPSNTLGLIVALSKQNTINNGITQLYITRTHDIYVRTYYSSSWTSWERANENNTFYVSTTGNDNNLGTYASPFRTINKALDRGAIIIGIYGGIYEEQIDISKCKNNTLKLFNVTPTKRVIFRDPDYLLATSATLVSGRVYSTTISKTIVSTNIWLYQDGVADPKTVITEAERHPLQRRFTHRCEDTIIEKCTSATVADAMNEIENADENVYKWYLDGTTLYFSSPQVISSDHPICYSTGKQLIVNLSREKALVAFGIETKYMGFSLESLSNADLTDCRCINAFSTSGFQYKHSNVILKRCEVCHTCHSTYGDGISANSVIDSDADAPQTKCILIDCYSHDNHDDGFSDHLRCESTIIGGLFEYNGKGGVTPAMGAHCTCMCTMSRYNGKGFYYCVETTEDATRKFGDVICYSCISIGNTEGFFATNSGNKMWLFDCKAIGNDIGYRTSYDATLYMVDCRGAGNTTLKYGSNIYVNNTEVVT